MPTADPFIAELKNWDGYHERRNGESIFGRRWAIRNHWTSIADEAWCDMFLAECALLAGGPELLKLVGDHYRTTLHAKMFIDDDRWTKGDDGIRKGDVVFFDWDNGLMPRDIDHVGVVYAVDDMIHTVEGNRSNRVSRFHYSKNHNRIVGYGRPRYTTEASLPQVPDFPEIGFGPTLDVKSVQELLLNRGYSVGRAGVDGDFGPDTATALKRFQRRHGLTDTGTVDEKTWDELWVGSRIKD